MAQRLVDDLDPTQFAERTVNFAVDGKVYDIDLSKENIERLHKALRPFIDVARPHTNVRVNTSTTRLPQPGEKLNVSRSHRTPPGRAAQLVAIREWARRQGYEVSDRGRVPEAILEAFEKAHARDADSPLVPQFTSPV